MLQHREGASVVYLYVILLVWITSYRVSEMLCNIQAKCRYCIAVCIRRIVADSLVCYVLYVQSLFNYRDVLPSAGCLL